MHQNLGNWQNTGSVNCEGTFSFFFNFETKGLGGLRDGSTLKFEISR